MTDTTESIDNDDSKLDYVPPAAESDVIADKETGADKQDEGELDPREAIARKHAKEVHGYNPEAPEEEDEDDKQADDDKDPPEPEMVTVKVNGKERQVEKAKVDEAGGVDVYQKRLAAEDYLREAGETRRLVDEEVTRLRKKEQELAERESALSRQDAHQQQQDNDLPDKDGDQQKELADKVKAVREAIFSGDEEGADKAFEDLMTLARTYSTGNDINLAELSEKAAEDAVALIESKAEQKLLRSAYQQFQHDYPDIDADPRLRDMADRETEVISEEHPDWDYNQVMKEAGKRVSDYVAWKKGEGPAPSTQDDDKGGDRKNADGKQDKLEEKRAISTPRAGAGRKQPDPPKKPQTNKEYIAELRKKRGLDPY